MGCCNAERKETNEDDRNKIINNKSTKVPKKSDSIELDNTLNDTQTGSVDLNKDYISYSLKQYSDDELLNMDINEISIGFHPTRIPNNKGISFHPFFLFKIRK